MKIDIISHSRPHQSNFIYTDFFVNQDVNIILLTYNLEKSQFLDDINSHIVNSIIDLKIDENHEENIKQTLQKCFISLNIQLYSKFKKIKSKEHGISLLLCVTFKNKAYIVQFGRFLCGKIENKNFSMIGNDWNDFFKKSMEEVFLLGKSDENISIEVYEFEIKNNSYFFVLPDKYAQQIIKGNNKIEQLQNLSKEEKFPYFIARSSFINRTHKVWFKRYKKRFIAVIMSLVIVFSILYVFYGKNWLADQQNVLKTKNKEFIQNELLGKLVETHEALNSTLQEIYDLNLFPNKKLQTIPISEILIKKNIIQSPLFDMYNLYIATKNSIIVVRKRSDHIKWEKEFISDVVNIELLDANRVLVATNDSLITCLHRETGLEIWKINCGYKQDYKYTKNQIRQISLERFKQLDSSLIILPAKHSITFLNNISGDFLFRYESTENIKFISDFDILERSLYLVENKSIIQIRLEVKY